MMKRVRRWLVQVAWTMVALRRGRRRVPPCDADVRRIDFPTQMKRTGLAMTPALRDRLRPRWLHIVWPKPRSGASRGR